ncbi:mitochondrial 2-oxoglutarate/malate carrier protein-like [Eurosta solidaginis]|uniref:mitochondrial 2-oxoglutarate/malate carrier protein-like n=1 Tax=Eurosta solidaginis TaxID=178769 RepID=UPI0035308C62
MSQKENGVKKKEPSVPTVLKYAFGGIAAVAGSSIMHPMDLFKTRMQITSESVGKKPGIIHVITTAVKEDGIRGLYRGLTGTILRHSIYSTIRLGLFTSGTEYYRNKFDDSPTVVASVFIAIIAGALGSFVSTPADVCLIRMMSDARLPPEERRNYTNVINALTRIVKEEGLLTLWRGAVPTVGRAIVVNTAQLASYGQFRNLSEKYLGLQEGMLLHFAASTGSGLLTATVSLPVDLVKTRIQNMKVINGKPEYRGISDATIKTIRSEGTLALWSGYIPYSLRIVPNTILVFVFLEQLNTLYFKNVLGEVYKSKI